MSGTSLDGVDAVLCRFDQAGHVQALAHAHEALSGPLREQLLALNRPGDNELHGAALAGNGLARLYAQATRAVLARAGVEAASVRALGAHGQTVRHRPLEFDGTGYTLQLLNGALLAELTGIDTVCDFRSRDLAASGQGAPLAPGFHAALFGLGRQPVAVLNIGGISNLSLLREGAAVIGFDCGPGNVLMDLWCLRHRGQPYDRDGAWARGGQVLPDLLQRLLAEPYFSQSPPKSTGRDLFHAGWLEQHLAALPATPAAQDVMRTLLELTCLPICDAVRQFGAQAAALWVCGGGAFNQALMARLATLLAPMPVASTAERGVPPDQMEAMAFAWLARAHVLRLPGNLPSVTGARGPRVLGAMHPGDSSTHASTQ